MVEIAFHSLESLFRLWWFRPHPAGLASLQPFMEIAFYSYRHGRVGRHASANSIRPGNVVRHERNNALPWLMVTSFTVQLVLHCFGYRSHLRLHANPSCDNLNLQILTSGCSLNLKYKCNKFRLKKIYPCRDVRQIFKSQRQGGSDAHKLALHLLGQSRPRVWDSTSCTLILSLNDPVRWVPCLQIHCWSVNRNMYLQFGKDGPLNQT